MKRILFLFILITSIFVSCDSVHKVIKINVPGITDYKYFDLDIIQPPEQSFQFYTSNQQLAFPSPDEWAISRRNNTHYPFEEFLEETNTVSFLVIRNDTILYENYFNGHQAHTPAKVFSVTKSIVSALVGIAISDGYIESANQAVADFIPAFQHDGREHITINHLLNMTDGLNFSDYKTTHRLLGMYFNNNQQTFIDRIRLKHEPGSVFEYKSISTLILGVVLENATGSRLAHYIEEKIWKPLGMEYTAAMMLDSEDGTAMAYGGMVARARDMARIGRLYLNNGKWDDQQIIPTEWVTNTPLRDTVFGQFYNYNKAWWLDTYLDRHIFDKRDFYAGGHGGQVIYINPEHNLIIVRQGKNRSGIRWGRSISKFAHMLQNDNQFPEEPEYLNRELLVGQYYNPINGSFFSLLLQNNQLVIQDGSVSLELDRESSICYTNRKENVRVIVNVEEGIINGLFLDRGSRYLTFFNRDFEVSAD